MKKPQIAAQLFTLRDFIKTPAEIAVSLKKVKAIGYDAVQVSGMGPIDEAELVKICEGEGLTICATHEPGKMIVEETEKVIDRLHKLNCRYTAYPYPHVVPTTRQEAVAMAQAMNAAAKKMAAAGVTLCYHNHAIEFTKLDGELMLDIFYNNAPDLKGELDTFWIQAGGNNPARWIDKLGRRQPLLHLKDFGVKGNDRMITSVGNGNLDWAEIIAAGDRAGVEWFIVEQDDCQKDPFDSLADSYHYLCENFAR